MISEFVDWLVAMVALIPPKVFLAIFLVLGGIAGAYIARPAVRWLVRKTGFEAALERIGVARLLYKIGVKSGFAIVAGRAVFWLVLALTAFLISEVFQLRGVSALFAALAAFLPRLLAAGGVMVAGFVAAEALSRIVTGVAEGRKSIERPELIGRIAYYGVVVLCASVALQQLGIDIGLINGLLLIAAAGLALTLALGLGLGARAVFGNVVARHYASRLYKPGDAVRVGEVDGTIVAFHPTGVIIATDDGEVVLPSEQLLTRPVALGRKED